MKTPKFYRKPLESVSDKQVKKGLVFIEIGFAYRFSDKDLRRVEYIDRKNWVVYTGEGIYKRSWYCTPQSFVFVKRQSKEAKNNE